MLIDRESFCDAETFLKEEAEAWAPFEALLQVPDDVLERPGDEGGPLAGSSGRILMFEMAHDQEKLLVIATELKDSPYSLTLAAIVNDWEYLREEGVRNKTHAQWRDVPMSDVRRRFLDSEMELRKTLAQVPDAHWVTDSFVQGLFWQDTIKGCKFRSPQLAAVLGMAKGAKAAV